MDLTLYCNSFGGRIPAHSQYNQKNLMCGAHFLSPEMRQVCTDQGFILDDTGTNISGLNNLFGDLTGLFWVWKNTDEEFVGTNQYRRFYDEEQLSTMMPLREDVLYISQQMFCNFGIWHQYMTFHGSLGLNMLIEAARMKRIPITEEMVYNMHGYRLISPCNMFFGHRNLFDKVCNVLFDTMFELYDGCRYSIKYMQHDLHGGKGDEEKRLLAFLAERVLNIFYVNHKYYFGNIHIQPVNYGTFDGQKQPTNQETE